MQTIFVNKTSKTKAN